MNKEKIEKYIDTALFLVGITIFGMIAYVVIQFGSAILKSVF
jgi:hypothetical protein